MTAPGSSPPPPPVGSSGFPAATATAGRPDLAAVLRAEYRLLLRSAATRGRLLVVAGLAAISVLAAVIVAANGPVSPAHDAVGYANQCLSTLIPVAVLVFGAGTLGDLIDDSSLVYLWLRPVPRWVHVVAAWAATVTIAVPLVLVPVVVSTAIISTDAAVLRGTAIGGLVAVAGYAGLFVTAGVRLRRALAWGLVYILIWEGFVALAGKTASKLALRSYTRSILVQETGYSLRLAEFTYASGVLVPLLAAVVLLAYGARRLSRMDIA